MSEVTRYFEDLVVGEECETAARTVTEADIVNFAGISGDYNALHTDEEFAKGTIFGTRIAHGLLGLSISSGLFTRSDLAGEIHNSLMAFLGLEWKFLGPIKAGDTIKVKVKVKEKRETSKSDRGIVIFERTVVNQREEVVQRGDTTMMIARRKEE